ncbi:ATP-dependent Clp protease proteolytic subunit [Paenibacillus larvae]|nr:ATP-dependent Clp protease proteolytic subunit [Paenibacillus larvae]MDT2266185.1 ATP-dependent Clp protease proteolytic subunit [Paenibacillus larvae]
MQKLDKLSDEKLQDMLDAETWLSADEAFEYGLCDVVQEVNTMAASISDEFINRYKMFQTAYFTAKNTYFSG